MKIKPEPFSNSGMSRRRFLRHSTLVGSAAAASMLLPWRAFAAMADGFPVADTACGKIRGMDVAGIKTFRGIRYGASTAGKNRFMPPGKPEKWTGIRDAFAYGPAAPQAPGNPLEHYTLSVHWDDHVKAGVSEDCLRLNIWTPALNDAGNRPVFFYIHGGGFTSGSGGIVFNGDPLARMGDAVVITVNHRLGPLGYLNLGQLTNDPKFESAGVAGMLDLVAALEWVQENISNFGGDPGNVMIFGQSGGGRKTSTLMVMPSAKGLFHKAGVQSSSQITLGSPEQNAGQAERLLAELGISRSRLGKLQDVPWEDIIQAEANSEFSPVVDGNHIPRHPFDPTAPEVSSDVPMIVGYTREDAADRNYQNTGFTEETLKKWAQGTYPDDANLILTTYRKVYPNATPFQIQSRIRTDARLRLNATTMVERKSALNRGKAYLFVMQWPSPAYEGRWSAVHGVDLGMVMGNPRNAIAGNTAEARKMADIIGSCYAAFGKTGDPDCDKIPHWPAYDTGSRATMLFDLECRVENDPTGELRLLWEKLA